MTRILAIRLHAFGDVVLTLPYLQALRRRLPDARIDLLTRGETADVPRHIALFDRVFEIRGGRNHRLNVLSALLLTPVLRARRYDAVLDLQGNRISRTVRRLLSPRVWSEFDRFGPRLAGERTREAIEAAGFGPLSVVPLSPVTDGHQGVAMLRAAGWSDHEDLVVLNPASTFDGRQWPLDNYVEFSRRWLERRRRPARFLLLGVARMGGKAQFVEKSIGDRAVNLVGRCSASEALAMLQQATLLLSEDSGLMHLGWAAGLPTVGLFGASRAAWAAPHGNYCAVVNACCEADGVCADGSCRLGTPTCLARRSAAAVVDVALGLLERVASVPDKVIPPTASVWH